MLVLVLAACDERVALEPGPGGIAPAGQTPAEEASQTAEAPHPDAAWFSVLGVTEATGNLGIDLVESQEELSAFWDAYGFDQPAPGLALDEHVVAFVRRGDNACPDEAVEVRLVDATLEHTLLAPPGGCTDPYIVWAYTIAYHRGGLGAEVTVRSAEDDGPDGELVATFVLSPYDGPRAPAPTPPPRQPTADEAATLFADHPIRRCAELEDPREDVFARQQPRDGSGEPTGPPLSERVPEDVQSTYAAEHPDEIGWLMVDQAAGEWVVGVTADVDGHRERLEARHPGEHFRIVETPHAQRDLAAAQAAVRPLHGGEDGGGPRARVRRPGVQRPAR